MQWMTTSFCKTKRKEMKSVLCENPYFVKWKSVLCKTFDKLLVLYETLISTFLKSFCEEASANLLFSYNHHRDTCFLLQPRRTSSSLTMTEGISNMSRKRRSWKLRLQTQRTQTLWVSGKLKPKKENNFNSVCHKLLQDIMFTSCWPFHYVQISFRKVQISFCFVMQVTFCKIQ